MDYSKEVNSDLKKRREKTVLKFCFVFKVIGMTEGIGSSAVISLLDFSF